MRRPQLFLLHFAGGNCYSFQFMIEFLKNFSVISLELPGRGNRINEELLKDLSSASKDIYLQILDRLDGSPFAIYGHSLGAAIALQVTHMLERANKWPTCMFVSGHEGPIKDKVKKKYLLANDGLIMELIKYGGVPSEILEDEDFLNFFLPILRADFEVAEKDAYVKTLVNTPIFAMMGDKEEYADKIQNWENFTKSTFKFKLFKGGHFFIRSYPNEIAKIITDHFQEDPSKSSTQ